jgi:phage gp36-like protein
MTYCTYEDLCAVLPEPRLIELTDDENTGQVNMDRIGAAIAAADDEINGYLAGRYDVPLAPVPGLIKNLAREIALFNLYSRTHDDVPKIRQGRHDHAVSVLTKLAAGAIALGVTEPPPAVNADTLKVSSGDRLFSDAELAKF